MCVAFAFNRSFYSTTSVYTVSMLILHPSEIQIRWSQTGWQRKSNTTAINQGVAREMLAYLAREHNKTSQTRKKKRKMVSKGDRKGDRSSEERDAISKRLQEQHIYVLIRNLSLIHI